MEKEIWDDFIPGSSDEYPEDDAKSDLCEKFGTTNYLEALDLQRQEIMEDL